MGPILVKEICEKSDSEENENSNYSAFHSGRAYSVPFAVAKVKTESEHGPFATANGTE